MYLGELIKKYRQEHDLSMQTFADRCGVSKGYIAMLEKNVNSKTGEPVVPSIETFIKVAGAMNIPLAKLVDMVDENQPVNLDRSVHLEEVLGDLADKKFKSHRVNDILNKCTDTDGEVWQYIGEQYQRLQGCVFACRRAAADADGRD